MIRRLWRSTLQFVLNFTCWRLHHINCAFLIDGSFETRLLIVCWARTNLLQQSSGFRFVSTKFLVNWRWCFNGFQRKCLLWSWCICGGIRIVYIYVEIDIDIHIDIHLLHRWIIGFLYLICRCLMVSRLVREKVVLSLCLERTFVTRNSEWVLSIGCNIALLLLRCFDASVPIGAQLNEVFDYWVIWKLDVCFGWCRKLFFIERCGGLILFE